MVGSKKSISRDEAARVAYETLAIIEDGIYGAGAEVLDISEWIELAVSGTVEYPQDHDLPELPDLTEPHDTKILVRQATSLHAAQRFVLDGGNPVQGFPAVLNFASATNPGGGFLRGSIAQEEDLARSSALYACLRDRAMYEHHKSLRDPMYTGWIIYSPQVPVIRNDFGHLLLHPFSVSFITCPAVNAKAVLEKDSSLVGRVHEEMRKRIDRVLHVAALHRHKDLVLGAWGCGVFGNNPEAISNLFHESIHGKYAGRFGNITFAILDNSEDQKTFNSFWNVFERSSHGTG